MKRIALLIAAVAWAGTASAFSPTSVVGSSHDLSATGKDVNSAATQAQGQVCVYCHMPHNASNVGAPLWNRTNSTSSFQMYSSANSSTFVLNAADTNTAARAVGPVSLACLSCHDGVTAFNSLNQTPMIDSDNNVFASSYTFATTGTTPAAVTNMAQASAPGAGSADLGTDLTNDHPISFTYDSALASLKGTTLRDPAANAADGNGTGNLVIYRAGGSTGSIAQQMLFVNPIANKTSQLECASCHEPHMQGDLTSAASNYPFLIKSNQNSNLCLTCHAK
ncbi:MAG TPA: cytochrome c3 family protein [Anaeromyxobacteraceae bacterium]|jgi:predicted CXXCH cytochrome family protein|nr:cytochrome c3 family protein [Anaeromyxobacteraceae bacterium]